MAQTPEMRAVQQEWQVEVDKRDQRIQEITDIVEAYMGGCLTAGEALAQIAGKLAG